ncbi:hypothetical protein SAMN05444580_104133 [Rhodococcus tukisamuensis]|uniref:Uncharacterized protein n=2 Tax=Rhodococcus tukisamuensis TaxID=168276 RepID=A0A1G6UCY8_9NOCA|nr:hypothetical protein SAMN05444580_104133 [Rhodococcus tukisamuensis]
METFLFGAIAITVLVGLDQVGLWAERKGWVYWRKGKRGDAGGGMLGVMDELLSPAKSHTLEEIANKQHGRVDVTVGDGGWVDLDGGRAHLPAVGRQ